MSSRIVRAWPLALAVVIVAACSSTTGGTSPAPSSVAQSSLTASSAPVASSVASPASSLTASPSALAGGDTSAPPSPSATAGPSAKPADIDPCTLLTADEASRIIGAKLGAGVSGTADPLRTCTFRKGSTEVRLLLAPPAPDAKTAQAYWDMERAQVPADVPIKDLKDFDRAAYAGGSVGGLSLSALFVIDGNYFFDLVCMMPACSQAASVGGAQHIVGRLP